MRDPRDQTAAHLRTPEWYRSATRWTQLTLAEDDPVRFDPDFWIDIFKRTRSNAACLSAGGYIAYYPSRVPLHYVSKFIGDGDPFGTLVDGARRLGMHVMARVDPHAIHQEAADAHPEWVAVDKDGNRRRHWAYPEVWVTCPYGDYNNVFMIGVVEEITREYDIDAVFANRWQGHGVCYCEACTARFRAATGYRLPRQADAEDPVWQAWTAWRRDVLTRMIVTWDEAVKAIRPHASFIPNMGGASLMEFDLGLIRRHCPFIVVDDQGRRGTEPLWMAGRNGKRIRATFPERPVVLITSIGPEEEYRWKDSVTTKAEIASWITNGVAHGMLPWFTKFNGVVPDARWVEPVSVAFGLHADLEPALEGLTPSAEIALIDPATTLKNWAPEMRRQAEADDLGFYHALVEAGLPFEFLSDQTMTAEALDRFKLVILPNAVCLSDEQCRLLTDYAERGGSVIAANQTATRTADGGRRERLGLGELLGARIAAPVRGPVKNTYVALNGAHPINRGYEGAGRIIGGTRLIAIEPTGPAELPFLYVPDFPDLPMEEVYPREEPRGAAVLARETAAGGRVAYIPWNIGEIFWQVLAADHQRLIENTVRWALRDEPAVEVAGDALLDVGVRRGADGIAVSLFNLTNPMMMKGPVRRIHPVNGQKLVVGLPAGTRGAHAEALVAGRPLEARRTGDRLTFDLPEIGLLEVVRIRWS